MELSDLRNRTLEIFGVTSTEDLGGALMECVLSGRTEQYAAFAGMVGDLGVDWLQKIYQYDHADRKEKKQDYTPANLADFMARLVGQADVLIDLCAGSGALTIQQWRQGGRAFVLYEIDERVIPWLLFNLAVRNIAATVIHGDVLQDETRQIYAVTPGEQYATVTAAAMVGALAASVSCVSNPPYNLKWRHPIFAQSQARFAEYGVPPAANANFAFVLTGLAMVTNRAAFLLPYGVLTSSAEKDIRRNLIDGNVIEAVIALPESMFESTSIPVCLLLFSKKKDTTDIMFLDMRETHGEEVRLQRGQYGGACHENQVYKKTLNVLREEDMDKALQAICDKADIAGFCRRVSVQTIAESDYNLTPGRYIEHVGETVKRRDYPDIIADLNRVRTEKNAVKVIVNQTVARQLGLLDVALLEQNSKQTDAAMNKGIAFTGLSIIEDDYIRLTPSAGITLQANTKDFISSVMVMALNLWRQHIYYLNNEENRYLAELRDTLLPDLMSGKIQAATPDTSEGLAA